MNARLRKKEGGLTLLGKIVSIVVGMLTLFGTLGLASVKLLGLETSKAHDEDMVEVTHELRIVRGLLECHMQGVRYQECPAVKADLEKRP